MFRIDDYILGNDVLHDRFRAAIQIVGKAACNAPDHVTIVQLKNLTGHAPREIETLCRELSYGGVLEPLLSNPVAWRLACDPVETTLEDVFRCILAGQFERGEPSHARRRQESRAYRDVDLMLMQISIAINQIVFRHLRQFSLCRLKLAVSAMYPFTENLDPQRRPQVNTHTSVADIS